MSEKRVNLKETGFRIASARPTSSMPYDVVRIIDMITLDPAFPPHVVGSYKYAVHEYPNDVDLFEFVRMNVSQEAAAKVAARRIAEIVKAIDETTMVWLGDLKVGTDARYKVDIGKLHGSELIGYEPEKIREEARRLYDEGLLDKKEIKEWLGLILDEPGVDDFLALKSVVHEKSVIRWTMEDVMNGVKRIDRNTRLTLVDAILQQSVCKIDVWCHIGGRFTEITNWYAITYKKEGKETFLTEPITNYEKSLLRDIQYYRNPLLHKAMKLSKRIWNFLVMKNRHADMIKLYPLFSSPAAKMYQIMGECEVIGKMLERLSKKELNMTMIHTNMDDWKTRLGTVLDDNLPIELASKLYGKIDAAVKSNSKGKAIAHVQEVYEILEAQVDKNVLRYFKRREVDVDTILADAGKK